MIRLICPGCEKTLQVNDTLAGRAIDCPSCKTRFRVPAPEPAHEDLPAEKPAPASRRGAAAPKDDDRDPPPRKRRDDDEDEDDRPRSRRRDDDDDDRPRGRRRDDDDDDEDDRPRRRRRDDDDEDDRPRPRVKKRRKVVRSGGGGFASWSPIVKILSISAVVAGVCVAIGFIWPPIILVPAIVGGLLMFVGGIMFYVVAFKDDVVQGLMCMFVPFYSLFYLITHFGECKDSLLMQLGGFAILMCSMCSGIGGLAVMADNDAARRGRKAEIQVPVHVVPGSVLG